MFREHPLKQLVRQQKMGVPVGICSICSSHPYVIEAAIEKAVVEGTYLLIEATANQVNQYGGYTGMLPKDFAGFVKSTADRLGLQREKLILGGDHLGPLVWKSDDEASAMKKAEALIIEYVKAGFSKIHIDTSMHLGSDEKSIKLDTCTIAKRAAKLYKAAERAFKEAVDEEFLYHPVYVIGSEVPIPGGTHEDEGLEVTRVSDLEETLACFENAFQDSCSSCLLDNVIAVVVQPGVEFGEGSIHEYRSEAAVGLSNYIKYNKNIVFEGHSTDYQMEASLREMVKDGIAILKVGPALTFALREGLFALASIERELLSAREGIQLSHFPEVLEASMLENPVYWDKYYRGDEVETKLAREYSLSDRCRYYLSNKAVIDSIAIMMHNLGKIDIPVTIISQFMPIQYNRIREGVLDKNPENLLKDKIRYIIDMYPSFKG